jgi:hypothetical protein
MKKHGENAGLMGLAREDVNRRRIYASQNATATAAAGTAQPTTPGAPGARTYGQVRRRNSAVDRSKIEIDE